MAMTPTDAYLDALSDWQQLLPSLSRLSTDVDALGRAMMDCWARGGKVMFAGNGGSCADAMHFAEELSVRFHRNRRALAALALTDASAMSCCGNDFGFDQIFSRQIEALGKSGDLFVGISTSGNSINIIRAVDACRGQGVHVALLLGKDGGSLKGRGDVNLIVPSPLTHRVQEVHKLLFHALCIWIDEQVLSEAVG